MAVNKPVGGNARKDAVRKRSRLKTNVETELHWTKRSKASGRLMDNSATANPIQGCSMREESQLN
jgi:hypothetical protein